MGFGLGSLRTGLTGTRQGGMVGAHFTTRQTLALSPGNGRHSLRSLDRDVAPVLARGGAGHDVFTAGFAISAGFLAAP
jgi:hypothetical protein